MVVEADESDRSFLLLAPVVAVVTTIDREHLDHYASLEEIQDTFTQFVNRVPFYGAAVLCLDEPNVQAIVPRVTRPVITYGTSSQADLVIADVELQGLASRFRLTYRGDDLGEFHLPGPPGIHNVRNAAAAAAVALYLDVPADLIRAGLENFTGVGRRFEVKGVIGGVTLIDDYGHHPAEIRATLEAARGCAFERLLVLFQPHRYTRTQHLWDDFCRAFNQADVLVITDIYAAGEPPIPGITASALADAIRAAGHKNVVYRATLQEGIEYLLREVAPGRRRARDRRRQRQSRPRRTRHSCWEPQQSTCGQSSCDLAIPKLLEALPRLGVERLAGASLAERTSLGIGGVTDLLLIRQHAALPELVSLLRQAGIPYRFLGGGTNLLVPRRRTALGGSAIGPAGPRSSPGGQFRLCGRRRRPRPHRHLLRQARSGRHGGPDRRARHHRRGPAHECRRLRHADRFLRPRGRSSTEPPKAG